MNSGIVSARTVHLPLVSQSFVRKVLLYWGLGDQLKEEFIRHSGGCPWSNVQVSCPFWRGHDPKEGLESLGQTMFGQTMRSLSIAKLVIIIIIIITS